LDKKIVILVGLCLAIIAALNIFSMKHMSFTTDEPSYYSYGASIIRLNSNRNYSLMWDSKMPFSALNVLPRFLGRHLKCGEAKRYLSNMGTGRIVTVLFSLILGFYVFLWSYKLYGNLGGIISLTLYTFSPNILAHSRLITSDLYAACLTTVALYYFWRLLERPSVLGLILSSVTLGIAQLTKYSCLFLYPIFTIIFIIRYWPKVCEFTIRRDIGKLFKSFSKLILVSALFSIISILIINIGF
jgi:dolichyl-phosphate-mannose--protein O-mannosyl transferase